MQTKTIGLSYVGDEGDNSRYTYFIEGRRVFDVLIDRGIFVPAPEGATLPEGCSLHPIFISMVDAPEDTRQPTKGFAAMQPYVSMEGVTTRVSGTSVTSYVQPRAAALLARLFVPPAAA